MTSLYSNYAIKSSLGLGAMPGLLRTTLDLSQRVSEAAAPDRGSEAATITDRKVTNVASLEEKLYNSRANAKMVAAKASMYMKPEWRASLYRQLDSLLDVEEWESEDEPLGEDSFATFLSLMLVLRPNVRPGFGLTLEGDLIATWQNGDSRLTIECKPGKKARWVLTTFDEDVPLKAAGENTVGKMMEVLAPYRPSTWFNRA